MLSGVRGTSFNHRSLRTMSAIPVSITATRTPFEGSWKPFMRISGSSLTSVRDGPGPAFTTMRERGIWCRAITALGAAEKPCCARRSAVRRT